MEAAAKANSNIALIKYWGKREKSLNLPAVGSISLTLAGLSTTTSVCFDNSLEDDQFSLNGDMIEGREKARVSSFLDLIREMSGKKSAAKVASSNNFPTAAGLASSASAFAALALAASKAAGLDLDKQELSVLARRGSGSAARSIFGGFVEMFKGNREDGTDAAAVQIADKDFWDLRLLIAVTSTEKKKTSSTSGMTLTRETSPYYDVWIDTAENDLAEMRTLIKNRDFQGAGELTEYSCLKMHALAMAGRPGLIYWNGTTLDVMRHIREMREDGTPVYFTVDAGPQVKALCEPASVNRVKQSLLSFPGVEEVLETGLGGGAEIIEAVND